VNMDVVMYAIRRKISEEQRAEDREPMHVF
jgi:hypothetical protein